MKTVFGVAGIAGVVSASLVGSASSAPTVQAGPIRVRVRPRVVDYGPARVFVSGLSTTAVSVRLLGANDPAGRAFQWNQYRWHPLRLEGGTWQGAIPAAPLRGIYRLQFQANPSKRLVQSPHWLLRVFPPGTLERPAFRTPRAVVRNYVRDLPGQQILVAARPWPQPAYDHRDPRLHRLFVIAYASRSDDRPGKRVGRFVTAVRNGYHGRWRLLEASVGPPD